MRKYAFYLLFVMLMNPPGIPADTHKHVEDHPEVLGSSSGVTYMPVVGVGSGGTGSSGTVVVVYGGGGGGSGGSSKSGNTTSFVTSLGDITSGLSGGLPYFRNTDKPENDQKGKTR